MRIRITRPGLYGAAGAIQVGTELDVREEPRGWKGRYDVISGGTEGKTAVTNPQRTDEPKAPLEAREKGGGWWAIYDADGKEVGKSLREGDAKAFNELSDEDRLAFAKAEA